MTPPTRTHQSRRRPRWKWWTRQSAAVSSSESGRRTLLDTNDGLAAPHRLCEPSAHSYGPIARKTAEQKFLRDLMSFSRSSFKCSLVTASEFTRISFCQAVEKHFFKIQCYSAKVLQRKQVDSNRRNCHVFAGCCFNHKATKTF